jgi:hypothetical protein
MDGGQSRPSFKEGVGSWLSLVESIALEKQRGVKSSVGSNPTLPYYLGAILEVPSLGGARRAPLGPEWGNSW